MTNETVETDKNSELLELLQSMVDSRDNISHEFAFLTYKCGLLLAPGLALGAIVIQNRELAELSFLFLIVLIIGFVSRKLLFKKDMKKFVALAVEKGFFKTEAEVFYGIYMRK